MKNFKLYCDYRYELGTTGPYTFNPYQEVNNALTGVIISIGRRASKGDKQVILVSDTREPMAVIYGGHWDMSLSLGVISKDSIQLGEMVDFLISDFWGNKKNVLEFEGITMTSMQPSGETEDVYDSATSLMYFESSVDINIMTEWQKFVPYLWKIKDFEMDFRKMPKTSDFYVTKGLGLEDQKAVSEEMAVVKYPILGYERVM
jgi:hypothetical protein